MKYALILFIVLALTFVAIQTVSAHHRDGHNPPGNSGECHGANDIECRPDPQPDHGKDCEAHGRNHDGNDDHCGPTPEPPVDPTPPTEPTPPPVCFEGGTYPDCNEPPTVTPVPPTPENPEPPTEPTPGELGQGPAPVVETPGIFSPPETGDGGLK